MTMDDFTRASRFVVITPCEEKSATIADGWDAMLIAVKERFRDGDGEPEWWGSFLEEIGDEDRWGHDDYGPFHFQDEIGDGGLVMVYRITD